MTGPEHLDVGAAALDALPAAEAAEFHRHMAGCPTCRVEYGEFLETAVMLATAVAEQPPASMRERVLAAAARTAQLPPLVTDRNTAGTPPPAASSGRHESHAPWWRRTVTLLAAAAAIVIVAGGAVLIGTRHSGLSPEQAAAQCIAEAPDATTVDPTVGTGGSVTIARSCDAAIVHVAPMPSLPEGKGYQLWVMAGATARSAGMVTRTVAPVGEVVVTGLRASDTDIGVSVEPAAGSISPTTTPVWVVPITS